MRHLQAVLLVTTLSLTVLATAAAQQQVSFERWTVAPFAAADSGSLSRSGVTDSVRRKVGYHQWDRAAMGAGVGAVLGTVLAFGVSGRCADCNVTTGERAQAALLMTGLSSAFGFLVGLATPKYVWEVAPEASEGQE